MPVHRRVLDTNISMCLWSGGEQNIRLILDGDVSIY